MKKYVLIGLGGVVGALARYETGLLDFGSYASTFPVATLAANGLGCFLLALFLAVSYEIGEIHPDLRLGLSVGLLGAFTTFSTLSLEVVILVNSKAYFLAASYLLLSTAIGLISIYFGIIAARRYLAGRKRRES